MKKKVFTEKLLQLKVKCTECEWTGTVEDCDVKVGTNEPVCPDCVSEVNIAIHDEGVSSCVL